MALLERTDMLLGTGLVGGIMRNNGPERNYILARLSGQGLEASGVAAGMSGSPVYFDGRLAGAVAEAAPLPRGPLPLPVLPIGPRGAPAGRAGGGGLPGAPGRGRRRPGARVLSGL